MFMTPYIKRMFHFFSGIRKRDPFARGNIKVQAGMHLLQFFFFSYVILLLYFNCCFLMQEDSRESLVTSEKKVRELETQLQDEQLVSANSLKVS